LLIILEVSTQVCQDVRDWKRESRFRSIANQRW